MTVALAAPGRPVDVARERRSNLMELSGHLPVVAGVSGSPASLRAVREAAREAEAHGCPLRLVHVFDWAPTSAGRPEHPGDLLQLARAEADRAAPGLWVTTELMEGNPVTALIRASRRATLTVIGDGDLHDRDCLPAGATAVQVAARAAATVMVARPSPAPGGPLLVGIGDAPADHLLDFAFGAAARRHTPLVAVHVGDAPERAAALRDAVAAYAEATGVEAELRVFDGDPAEVLRREARGASLTVVGARGTLPYQGMLGAVTQTLLHHGRGPLAILRGARPVVMRHLDALAGALSGSRR
ncbi:universal stress protein [Actinoplanes sp. NPDC051851]|uniref:universal stress protein n=1 Tax=Actinoplanes sp. NPDC051851 TaxID=3154753 RepID=UPI003442201D